MVCAGVRGSHSTWRAGEAWSLGEAVVAVAEALGPSYSLPCPQSLAPCSRHCNSICLHHSLPNPPTTYPTPISLFSHTHRLGARAPSEPRVGDGTFHCKLEEIHCCKCRSSGVAWLGERGLWKKFKMCLHRQSDAGEQAQEEIRRC